MIGYYYNLYIYMSMLQVNLWHVLMHGPLFYYIGENKKNSADIYFNAILILGLCLPFVIRLPSSKINNYHKIINYMHLIIFMPLLIYIGMKGKKLPEYYFPIMKILGISIIAIHLYYFIKKITNKN